MASFGLSGLASGVDTDFVVSQLMALERRPQVTMNLRQKVIEHRKTLLNDLNTKLKALKTATSDLRSVGTWAESQTVTSSNTAKLGVKLTGTATAPAGTYAVEVISKLATEQRTYNYTPPSNFFGANVTIAGQSYNIPRNTPLQTVVDMINNDTDQTVTAAAVNGQFQLTAKTAGTAGSFTVTGSPFSEDVPKRIVGTNAVVTVDGVTKTSTTSNTIADAIPGVEFTVKSPTAAGTTIDVEVTPLAIDTTKVIDKIKAFVEKYNDAVTFMREKIAEKKVPGATSEVDAKKGVLSNDPMMRGLESRLRMAISDPQAGNPDILDELAELGITTGAVTGSATISADSVAGKLVFDEAKLTAALDSDPTSVKTLLGGVSGVDGFAQRFEAILEPIVAVDGDIEQRGDSADSEIERIKDRMEALERRLIQREARYRAQFTAMESLLNASNSQGAWLSAQLTGLAQQQA